MNIGTVALSLAVVAAASGCTQPNPLYHLDPRADGPAVTDGPADPDRPAGDRPAETNDPADSGSGPDAAWPSDTLTNPDTSADSSTDSADGPPACGTSVPDLSDISGADGLVVAPDGTMYFTADDGTDGWIGRLRPGDADPDTRWVRLEGSPLNTGLALDATRGRLYLASVSRSAIVRLQLGGADLDVVMEDALSGGLVDINDLALDGSGTVYYSLQSDGHIHRVGPDGAAERVTTSRLGDAGAGQFPAGIAFGPGGDLFVGLKNGGAIYRLALTAGLERQRSAFGGFRGWANGLAFDSSGRLYVGVWHDSDPTRVVRLDADGAGAIDVVTAGRFSSLAFGRGALDCRDLFIAEPFGPLRRLRTDTPGLPRP